MSGGNDRDADDGDGASEHSDDGSGEPAGSRGRDEPESDRRGGDPGSKERRDGPGGRKRRDEPDAGEEGARSSADSPGDEASGEAARTAEPGRRSDEGPPDGRRLHPLSVVYRTITGTVGLGTLVFIGTLVASGQISADSLGFLALVLFGVVVSALYQVAYYLRFRYEVVDGSLDIASGVLSRRQREIPLRRIQNVDVAQNPVQRALGIAAVRIETAGGGETEAQLSYVDAGEADRLREVLRGRDGERGDEGGTAVGRASGEAATDGTVVFELPNRDLVVLSAFTIDRGASAISSVVAAGMGVGDPTEMAWVGRYFAALPGSGPIGRLVSAVLLFVAGAWVLSFVVTFARYYGFTLVRRDGELEYDRGLAQQYSGTIPLDKVQAISVRENFLKRQAGYATLSVETAGYAPGSDAGGAEAAVPLARRERVVSIARSIEPFEHIEVDRPPERARWRYVVRYAIATAVLGVAAAGVARFLSVPFLDPRFAPAVALLALVPVAAHLKYANLGHGVDADHFVAREGFWRRSTRIVPYYRIQTVVDARSVFQRRRRLGSVTADTASSASLGGRDATAHDVDEDRADELRSILRERLRASLRDRKATRGPTRRTSTAGDTGPDRIGESGDESGDPGPGNATGDEKADSTSDDPPGTGRPGRDE